MEHAAIQLERLAQGWVVRVVGSLTPRLLEDVALRYDHYRPLCLDVRAATIPPSLLPRLESFRRQPAHTVLPSDLGTPVRQRALLPGRSIRSRHDGWNTQGLPLDLRTLLTHEIRGPLGLSHLRLQALASHFEATGATEAAAGCRKTLEELDSVSRLLETYLSTSRPWRREPVDLQDLCRQAADHAADLPPAGQPVRLQLPDQPVVAPGDPQALYQLIWNILRNAIEAGGPPEDVVISLGVDATGVQLVIADGGPGFPRERLDHPDAEGRSAKPGGRGVGLAICHWIARRHHGNIALSNGPIGARVRVRLPRI